MNPILATGRLVKNPEFTRFTGSDDMGLLTSRPDHLIRLPRGALALVARFITPRTLAEALPDAGVEELRLIAELREHRVLLQQGELPRAHSIIRAHVPLGFAGAPWWCPGEAGAGALVVLGARFDQNTLPRYARGTARAPEAIRAASQELSIRYDLATGETLGYHDIEEGRRILAGAAIRDAGDMMFPPGATWPQLASSLSAEIQGVRAGGGRVLLLGGDHSLSLPAIAALDEPEISVIHIDAHTDLARVSFAGDIHHGNVFRHIAALPHVKQILQIGHRGIHHAPASCDGVRYRSLSVKALRALPREAIPDLLPGDRPVYVSIDIDGLDPSVAPGTPSPVPEGLRLTETRDLVRELTRGRRVVGADLCELLPDRDPQGITAQTAVQLLLEVMACMEGGA